MDKLNEINIIELKTILNRLNLDNKVLKEILDFISNNLDLICSVAIEAYDGEIPDFKICERDSFTRLSIICFKLIELKKEYKIKGISDLVFFDTIQDIKLRQEIYYDKNKKTGLSKDDCIWFRHLFSMHIFKLNTLQFQLFNMIYLDKEFIGEEYMTFSKEQKERLPIDSPVINVHIQVSADLNPIEVKKSFSIALKFFQKYYPTHKFKAFVCYSWLLYSKNKNLLKQNSNIIKFATNFHIISEVQDDEQAIENIYGKHYTKKEDYPVDTSLQRNVLLYPNNLGYACGIIEI